MCVASGVTRRHSHSKLPDPKVGVILSPLPYFFLTPLSYPPSNPSRITIPQVYFNGLIAGRRQNNLSIFQ